MSRRSAMWGPLVAAAIAGVGVAWGLIAPPDVASERLDGAADTLAPHAQTIALLGGLAVGDKLVGWHVRRIVDPDLRGVIVIDIEHRSTSFSLMVAPVGTQPEQAPVQTEYWAIYYGHVRPADSVLPRNVIRATTNALANRIRAAE